MIPTATISNKGAARWAAGHPWIYRSDVLAAPDVPGLCRVADRRRKYLGTALCSPRSEIRLRLLTREDRPVDSGWWCTRLRSCLARREGIDATAYRVVHGEGDGLPSLIVDRYGQWLVAQLLSAGLETLRAEIIAALVEVCAPLGILLRNDVAVRRLEGLPEAIEPVFGSVPEKIPVREGPIRYVAAPWTGQKTGSFLDQRANRILAGKLAKPGGSALDCFTYHGSFALHLARRSARVVALDASGDALIRGRANAVLNGLTNVEWLEGDAFEVLRRMEREHLQFDTVVVDPPAFAKSKSALPRALRGYKEVNLRAMRLLAPGGTLLTASCSHHVPRATFLDVLADAAADSGRRLMLTRVLGQDLDHPEILTIPETGYLKGAVLTRVE